MSQPKRPPPPSPVPGVPVSPAAPAVVVDVAPRVRVGSVTPFAERRFEGMAKLVYQLTTRVRQVTP